MEYQCQSTPGIAIASCSSMRIKTPLRLGLIATIAVACLGFPQMASALTIGDNKELGFVDPGIPAGDQDRTDYVNALIGLGLGQSTVVTIDGQTNTITRSMNNFGTLAPAVFALNGTGTSINLGTTGYAYLLAKYDGPNFGSEVWDISGKTGIINIPATGGGYGLSGWTLFTPGSQQSVPDGGATVALLGVALGGLGAIRRFVKR
jgi:hypothetical protein